MLTAELYTRLRSLGNFTLYYVDASFYQIARGLILPITVALAYWMQSSPPSRRALGAVGIVTFGFFVGAMGNAVLRGGLEKGVTLCVRALCLRGEETRSADLPPRLARPYSLGVFFGVAGSCISAYHAILIKQSLPVVQGSTMDMMFYSNAYAVLIMVPIAVVRGEVPELAKLLSGQEPLGRMLWGTIITVRPGGRGAGEERQC